MKQKTIIGVGMSLLILIGFLGCIGGDESGEKETLTIAGSTTVEPIATEAATAFMEKHSDVKITIQGGGSGTGIKMVGEGTVDIGNASRDIKVEEQERYSTLVGTVVARDAIAIIVHPTNSVENLTMEELQKIYAGEITNWKEIGGPDKEIVVVTRAEGSGTRDTFVELVLEDGEIEETSKVLQKPSNGAVKATVAGNENAIGYIGLGYVDDTVKLVKIDGVIPSPKTVNNETYSIARSLYMYTKGEPSGLAKEFLDFILGSEGQDIVEKIGYIRVD